MEPFKNLLNFKAATRIAIALESASASFSKTQFLRSLKRDLEPLELKQRMLLLTERLKEQLPADPRKSFPILEKSLGYDLSGFVVWPISHYVSEMGLEHFDLSMRLLRKITIVFTSEFAIRPFLIQDEERTLKQLMKWTTDEHESVRRLASEGSRPLLPWGQRLPAFVQQPDKTWPILEKLKDDESLFVRKSVANHINDHSKYHPDWIIEKLTAWKKSSTSNTDWIIRHGSRTLIKKGHAEALALQGYAATRFKDISIGLKPKTVQVGEALDIVIQMTNGSRNDITVLADIEIGFLKSNGKIGPKVFKGKTVVALAKSTTRLEVRLPLRRVTTRVYYSGTHTCTVLLNGVRQKTLKFNLKA